MPNSTRRARIVLILGQWFLIAGLIFFSLMTSTPLVSAHSEWQWSGWVLGLMTDAAFVMALTAESTLARFGIKAHSKWPAVFRWFTGAATVFLNTWASFAAGDFVGVAIHIICPVLVMILAEVGPVFMRYLIEAEQQTEEIADTCPAPVPAFLPAVAAEDFPVNAFLELVKPVPEEKEEEDVPEPAKPAESHMAPSARKTKAEAAEIIEKGWRHEIDPELVAIEATRHPVSVRRQYKALDEKYGKAA